MTADSNSTPPKTCTKCKECKPATAEFFHAYKRSPDGRRAVCKICRAAENLANNAEVTAKKRAHYAENRERLLAVTKAAYAKNIEARRADGLARHYKNRELRLQQMRAYREANRDVLLAAQRKRSRKEFAERYGSDLQFTLTHRVGALLRVSLRHRRKSKRMVELLGFTLDEFKAHLEAQFTKGMSWAEFMAGRIHIDHVIPVASFNITSDSCNEFVACWSLANLRPLWAKDNLSKGARITHLI